MRYLLIFLFIFVCLFLLGWIGSSSHLSYDICITPSQVLGPRGKRWGVYAMYVHAKKKVYQKTKNSKKVFTE